MSEFKGKTVLVTGGSRGIGATIAKAFGAAGATVIVTYAQSRPAADAVVQAIAASGGKAEAVQADAKHPAKLAETLGAVAKRYGTLDVLVNNAGMFLDSGMGTPEAIANFETMFAVNVHSVFAGTHAVLPYVADGGRIINIGSVMGQSAMWPNFSGYVASKFAVAGLSSGWAYDLAPRKITVNTVEPGPINTEMNDENGPMGDFMRANVPLGRYGQPQEVADLVLFLASSKASYITGARVAIGGGINA